MSSMQFRCEKCGKLLSVQAGHSHLVTCPHCQRLTAIPEGLASLPVPMIPGEVPATPAPGQAEPGELQEEMVDEGENKKVAAAMPWMLSLLLHLGVGLIAGFMGYVAVGPARAVPVPDGPIISGEVFDRDVNFNTGPQVDGQTQNEYTQNVKKHEITGYRHDDQLTGGMPGQTGEKASLIGTAGGADSGGLGWSQFSVTNGGPKVIDIGPIGRATNAYHAVYCIDASGSMSFAGQGDASPFDVVRKRMLNSIAHLREVQDFDVVFFRSGSPEEMPARRLLPATPENRAAAAKFITEAVPRGGEGTDPVQALNRSFDVLQNADATRPGKQIFLLTDGAFRDNEAVLRCIRERNKNREVHINTYLYGQQQDESIVTLMRKIAAENGGRFLNITE